ncbi:conserved hypothetical protein [uncultured Paludibacter sp.]|nr:conserved hypothetical protein [uncultured Paludibacter sp.]
MKNKTLIMKYIQFFIISLFFLFAFTIVAQKKTVRQLDPYQKIDKTVLQLPDSLSKTSKDIAAYIASKFEEPNDRARAAFVWIASNIQYDIKNMLAVDFDGDKNEIVNKVLKNRKGICMHYAELYSSVSNQLGIKTYVIVGYTKPKNFTDYLPHAWCASFLDNDWYLFDPTWGSGYIQNATYVKKLNNYYFKLKPEQIIISHIPFDPMWEFLNYPVTNQEFYEGKTFLNKQKPYFNYVDTLINYEKKSDLEKLIDSNRRIEENGIKNYLIINQLQYNKHQIEYYKNKITVENFNLAVGFYNEAVNGLNSFINYRNNQFNPKKTDDEIKGMIKEPENSLEKSRNKLKEIKNLDSQNVENISQLLKSIEEATKKVNEQKIFLDKYFKTPKLLRKSLFYKYSWMGVPIN